MKSVPADFYPVSLRLAFDFTLREWSFHLQISITIETPYSSQGKCRSGAVV